MNYILLEVTDEKECRKIINTVLAYKTLIINRLDIHFGVYPKIEIHGDKDAIKTLKDNFKKKKYKTVTYI